MTATTRGHYSIISGTRISSTPFAILSFRQRASGTSGRTDGTGLLLCARKPTTLARRYKIEGNPEVYWHTNTLFHDEAEEEIWANVIDIGNHLIGLVSGPTGW